MKNFIIQSFTLMMMMMTVSSAAVQNGTGFSSESWLSQIQEESKLLKNMSSELKHKTVMFPVGSVCWTEFFCFAEKSLNSTSWEVMKKLTFLLEEYNKVETVNCNVETTNRPMYLSKLVEKINYCSSMKVNVTVKKNSLH